MKTAMRFERRFSRDLPRHLKDQDIRLSEQFLEYFIENLSEPGDVVFDPFAGFGTTLISAARLGREGFGVEVNEDWHEYACAQLSNPRNLLLGDARTVDMRAFPRISLSISSPIYMHRHERSNPLSGFGEPGTYEAYLSDLRSIYTRVADRLDHGGHLLIEAANLKGEYGVTTFAWDLCAELRPVLEFEGEIAVGWDHYGYGYDHSYCLIFRPGRGSREYSSG